MQIDVHDEKKLVCVWLTGDESSNSATKERLQELYEKYKKGKYTVVVYHSGRQELSELTGALLRYNRKLFAQREVQAKKRVAGQKI